MTTRILLAASSALAAGLYPAGTVRAACDCGSTSATQPCTGQQIETTVPGNGRSIQLVWQFSSGGGNATCGQFANGDYWIAPAPGQSTTRLDSVASTGSGPLYLDLNPKLEALGFLGTQPRNYGNYVEAENILPDLPISFSAAVSVVAAVKKDEAAHGNCGAGAIVGSCVDLYQVVTVLDAVPPNAGADILRPAVDPEIKELTPLDAFDFERLPRKDFLDATNAAGWEAMRRRWSHHLESLALLSIDGDGFSEGGRAFRPDLLVPNYAAELARNWHNDLMAMFSAQAPLQDKRAALAAMLTYGRDIYYAVYTRQGTRQRNWGAGAGQHLGRFPAAAFFASLSREPAYGQRLRQVSQTLLGYDDTRGPHELEQINEGVYGPVWGDGADQMGDLMVGGYWGEILTKQCFDGAPGICNPSGNGNKSRRDPYRLIDGPGAKPGSNYMSVSLGPMRALVAEMFLMPEMCDIVNYDLLVEYIDRVHDIGAQTAGDICAPPDPRENPDVCDTYRRRNCQYYGLSNTGQATWGPRPDDPTQCIVNGPGQNGRFGLLHGSPVNVGGYGSAQVQARWSLIRGDAPTCARTGNDIIFANGFQG